MKKIIGIDLGTTNSVVAIMEGGVPKVIPNEEGQNTTPSVVAFTKDGSRLVGSVAKRQAITNPENTIASIKRFVGQKFNDVEKEAKRVAYKVKGKSNGDVIVECLGKSYSPEEISAAILSKLKHAAENYLGNKVTEAVITVPAYFNDAERQATKDAGKIAGLDVKRIINEPTAAALAYGVNKRKSGTVAVFDFGGGTFDVSILEIADSVIEVKATNGDTRLGGDDVDQEIVEYLIKQFKTATGIDISKDSMALQRLKEAAEKAKIELSSLHETDINLPYLTANESGPKHLVEKFTRSKLESLCARIFEGLLKPCKQAMSDAKLKASDIDDVILVGGSTRIPKVQQIVKDFFGKEPNKSVNPDEVVALGAAIQGSVLSGEMNDVLLLDVTPLSLGLETMGGVTTRLIERNTTIPTRKSQIFSTAENNQTSVDIRIVQGERELAKDNKQLGLFRLDGIKPAPRGKPQIEVTFDIDANGLVTVAATDKETGKEQKITITSNSGLDKSEVARMIKEAEEHAAEDKKTRETIETRNRLDGMISDVEKTIEEHGKLVSEEELTKIKGNIERAKKAVAETTTSLEDLKKESEELLKNAQSLMMAAHEASKNSPEKADQSSEDEEIINTEAKE